MCTKIGLSILGVAIWTLAQTVIHLIWIIYSYFWTACYEKPSYYDIVFVYLTYFYRNDCGEIDLRNDALFLNNTIYDEIIPAAVNETSSEVLYQFLKTVLKSARLPAKTSVASRTDLYLTLYFFGDVVWVITTILLLVGVCHKGKKKFFPIIFYAPWMFVSAYLIFLDVVCSVHIGLDMIYIQSYSTWLKFIGVSNYKDFESFNKRSGSSLISAIPTSIFISLSSRFFIVWLMNIICFSIILFVVIPGLSAHTGTNFRKSPKSRTNSRSSLRVTGDELDLNSSEARIRNWQLFYGAIDANSTMNSSSPETSNSMDRISSLGQTENQDSTIDVSVRKYFNLTRRLPIPPLVANNIKLQLLRSQLPWSYISPESNIRYPRSIKHKNVHVVQSTLF